MIGFNQGTVDSLGKEVTFQDFAKAIGNYKTVAIAISGICALTCLVLFFMSVVKLSTSSGNDVARRNAIKGILFSGIGLTLFGGATILIGIAWNILQ